MRSISAVFVPVVGVLAASAMRFRSATLSSERVPRVCAAGAGVWAVGVGWTVDMAWACRAVAAASLPPRCWMIHVLVFTEHEHIYSIYCWLVDEPYHFRTQFQQI